MTAGPPAADGSHLPEPLKAMLDAAPTAVVTDFDGTLAPIVSDPADARPPARAVAVLADLADSVDTVAVVSGRPAAFLADRLAAAGPRVRLVGLYGFEWVDGTEIRTAPEAATWLAPVADTVVAARAEAPPGCAVEDKRFSVTLHWRNAPETAPWAQRFADVWADRTGLRVQHGRLSLELRPPLPLDKGVVVERLAAGAAGACFFGDDVGDLAAFDALDRLARHGVVTVRVAVSDEESPPELAAAADVVVDGPDAALGLLTELASEAARRRR